MQHVRSQPITDEARLRYGVLRAALHDVDPQFRQVLTLRFFGRRSTSDIAVELQCSEAHVRMLQMQALVELQRRVLQGPPHDLGTLRAPDSYCAE